MDKKPLLDHVDELLTRLRRSLVWVVLGCLLAYFFTQPLLDLIIRPLSEVLPDKGLLSFQSPYEKLQVYFRIVLVAGMITAFPFLSCEMWLFLRPALKDYERRYLLLFFFLSLGAAISGIVIGYKWILPLLLKVFMDFGGLAKVVPVLGFSLYVNTVVGILILCAVFLEMPILMTFMSLLTWVSAMTWSRGRRMAVVVNAILAALLSPPDALSMILMLIPLQILYEAGILGARVAEWWGHEKHT